MINPTNYWRRVLELSEQMLLAAREEDWDKLALLEKERRELLYTEIPPLPDDANERAAIRQIIQYVINMDQQVIALCQNGQRILADKIQSLRVSDRALRAYGL